MTKDRSRRLWMLFGGGVIAFAVWFGGVIPATTCSGARPAGGSALLAYQLSRTPADIEAVFGGAGDPCRAAMIAAMDRANAVDLAGFIATYGAFLAFFFLALGQMGAVARAGLAAVGTALACDVLETSHHGGAAGQRRGAHVPRHRKHREVLCARRRLRLRGARDVRARADRRPHRGHGVHRRGRDGRRRPRCCAGAGGALDRQRAGVARHATVRSGSQRAAGVRARSISFGGRRHQPVQRHEDDRAGFDQPRLRQADAALLEDENPFPRVRRFVCPSFDYDMTTQNQESELVKKLLGRVGAGPEAQASGYPNEALTGW
jgi:hypothetical protein